MTALDDLVEGLRRARTSVFRLEGHQTYCGDEAWQAQERGEVLDGRDDLAGYCSLVSENRGRGVTWVRVRVVVEPWTPYTRWEIEEHFPFNVTAGEDVRLLHASESESEPDFWLVDDERAWLLVYDEPGRMTIAKATGEDLAVLRRRRDQALARADPLSTAMT